MTINKNAAESPKTSCVAYLIFGLVIIVLIGLLGECVGGLQKIVSPVATADPQEQAAINAVQNQSTPLARNMHESIAVVLVFLENEGHTQSIDGWYVSGGSDYYSVKFYFYLDGNHEFAEWWYYPSTRSIIPKNDWAYTFMGE
jgi:hypothetical protein